MNTIDVSRGDRYIRDNGHHIAGWHMDSPTLGRAFAACTDCNGTIERREDGTYVGPIVEDVCPAYQRALNEQAEGIADYYDGYGQGDD